MSTVSEPGTIAFVCAMPMELEPLVRRLALTETERNGVALHAGTLRERPVVAIVTGMGTVLAREAMERLLDAVDVARVVVVGITGALEMETPIGTLVLPEMVVNSATGTEHAPAPLSHPPPRGRMWTTDTLTTDPDELDRLIENGVVSLDMETAAIAAACEARGIPWSVFRAISDRACDGTVDEEIFRLSNQDGTPNAAAIERYIDQHPERLPLMARMAADAQLATETAAEAAIQALA